MKRLLLPGLVLASLGAGAGVATAFREKPKIAESGYHAVVVQGAVSLTRRKLGEVYWHSQPVNDALVDLARLGLEPVTVTGLDDDTVLLLMKKSD